ncbi:MAG: NUDIX hydrolase [Desulfuromonas sp.]|nr:MAG: NUDIX hydrolase [Desulfuromonas sp.]
MSKILHCPECQTAIKEYRNPLPAVDIIIKVDNSLVLIERKNKPFGWALPGGFVDYGEPLEAAARREAMEEVGMELSHLKQFRAYSDPQRDPRQHTISVVFSAKGIGQPRAGDDAGKARLFKLDDLPAPLCFDHAEIINDYFSSFD